MACCVAAGLFDARSIAADNDCVFGSTERASLSSEGIPGNDHSFQSSLSGDGRYVAFASNATNLILNDLNELTDIFVHDRENGITIRVSVSSTGDEANSSSFSPSISADGRYVVFGSAADNLVPEDNNGITDIFVHDLMLSLTKRVNVSSEGDETNNASHNPTLSHNGRFVAFSSDASNLVRDDQNEFRDVFVHDRDADEDGIFDEPGEVVTTRASVDPFGFEGNADSNSPSISADGRFVAFDSEATNLAGADRNGATDVFVKDLETNAVVIASVSSDGVQGNSGSGGPAMTPDGLLVAFSSSSSNFGADQNFILDVFVHDLTSGETVIVSVSTEGDFGDDLSSGANISSNGRFIAFQSAADNLVPDDGNGLVDIFVRDLHSLTTTRVNVNSEGEAANDSSDGPSISEDGRFIAFNGSATNLVPDDTNLKDDVFVRDRLFAGPDCNDNGVPDVCDVADGFSEDCNGNEIPDECEVLYLIAESGQLTPIGDGFPQSFIVADAPVASTDVSLSFVARGDFGSAVEYVDVDINGVSIGRIFEKGAFDCPNEVDSSQLVVPAAVYNDAVGESDAVISMVASSAVDPFPVLCESFISVTVEYQAITDNDMNGNGIPDDCETPPCPWDLDGSGDVGVKDLLFLLGNWGPCPPKGDCPADLDNSGAVDVKDLLILLGAWGPCP